MTSVNFFQNMRDVACKLTERLCQYYRISCFKSINVIVTRELRMLIVSFQ